ncbi:hypothetical protein K1T71_013644 [Dendrolimus kikuchii]|uniref:Uncharacterized protein n=1 Tax=Dendrolimus kikuchii TaxID=765133 RepID=A0ACC1CHE4_9NEOP|nr:hypothetical protein K1T71_013644 [Dendrolimus kikuchii]
MSSLELQFGNPDIIINRILQDIYKLRPISQEYQKDIIAFSIKVRNYVAAVTTIGCEDYLNGMNILSLILSKLPTVLISKWTDYSYPLFNKMLKPKLVILSEFLTEEAEKITKTAINLSSLIYGENVRHRGQAVLFNLKHNQEHGGLMCRYCHISKHLLVDCKKFKKSLCKDRWAYVKRHGICFKCLISKHKQTDCSEPVCEVEDCGRSHHRLLHYAENKNSQQNRVNITDVTEGETQTGIIAHVTANDNKVLLKTVSVYIHGPSGIERTRALLDDGSTVTLISDNLATKLGLRGHKHSMRVCGAWNNGEVTCESETVNFSLSNEEGRMFDIQSHPSSYESDRILQEMQEEMRHSFAIDALGISSKPRQNREERQAIEQLESTAKLIDRRWFVGLPWKNTNIKMPDSYDNALIRLRGIEKKMKNNVGFATRYKERVDHLLLNDYASELDSIPNPKHVWYLPHFGVDNPNKQKLRLVFDAAAKCKEMSLNDFLIQGPDLLISLYGIMLRFRERK